LWHLVLICKTVVVVGKSRTRLSWMFVPQSMWKLEQEADIWYTGVVPVHLWLTSKTEAPESE
jgi:hypothetical protein